MRQANDGALDPSAGMLQRRVAGLFPLPQIDRARWYKCSRDVLQCRWKQGSPGREMTGEPDRLSSVNGPASSEMKDRSVCPVCTALPLYAVLTERFLTHCLSSPAEQTQQKRQLIASCGILSPLLHPVLISLAPNSTAALTALLPSEFSWERPVLSHFQLNGSLLRSFASR